MFFYWEKAERSRSVQAGRPEMAEDVGVCSRARFKSIALRPKERERCEPAGAE